MVVAIEVGGDVGIMLPEFTKLDGFNVGKVGIGKVGKLFGITPIFDTEDYLLA